MLWRAAPRLGLTAGPLADRRRRQLCCVGACGYSSCAVPVCGRRLPAARAARGRQGRRRVARRGGGPAALRGALRLPRGRAGRLGHDVQACGGARSAVHTREGFPNMEQGIRLACKHVGSLRICFSCLPSPFCTGHSTNLGLLDLSPCTTYQTQVGCNQGAARSLRAAGQGPHALWRAR